MTQFIDPDDHIPHPLWKVTLSFKTDISGLLSEKISDAIEDIAVSVFLHNKEANEGDNWRIELTTYGEPDLDDVFRRLCLVGSLEKNPDFIQRHDISAERLPEKDWLKHVHDNFPPVVIGSFYIYGSHYTGAKPTNLTALQIDAATAFGSGEHETTKGCILCLEQLAKEQRVFKNGLDMGCGSGILAIVMAKLWPDIHLTAVDIDPESIIVTRRHAQMNGVLASLSTETGDGYHAPIVAKNGPYDIIVANILSGPLIEMAPDLSKNLKPGGYCILSGLLKAQKDAVINAHLQAGLTFVHSEDIGDWRALVLRKNT